MKLVSTIALVTLLSNAGLYAEASSQLRGTQTLAEMNKEETNDVKVVARKLQDLSNDHDSAATMNKEAVEVVEEAIHLEDQEEELDNAYYPDYDPLPLESEEAEDLPSMEEYSYEEDAEPLEKEGNYYYEDFATPRKKEVVPTYYDNNDPVEPAYYDYDDEEIADDDTYYYDHQANKTVEPTLTEDEEEYEKYLENAAMEDALLLEEAYPIMTEEAEFTSDLGLESQYNDIESFNQVLHEEENLFDQYFAQNSLTEEVSYGEEAFDGKEEEYMPYDAELEEEVKEENDFDLMEEAEELMEEAEELMMEETNAEGGVVDLGEEEFYDPLTSEGYAENEMYDELEDGIILP